MLGNFAQDYLGALGAVDFHPRPLVSGRLVSFDGLLMEATGLSVPVGTICAVGEGAGRVEAEVVGFRGARTLLMNLGGAAALLPRALVRPISSPGEAEVGDALLGRVIDGAGKPIDGLGPVRGAQSWPIAGRVQNPLDRGRVLQPMDVGVRAINGLLTIGQGQRIGIMAGSGVGKSVLLGMIVRAAQADVIVIGLIGERSREVSDFLETKVAGEARQRAVVVAVPANHSPVLRIRGALRATAIAEAFRAEGKNVLLIMDSLTRVAMPGARSAWRWASPPPHADIPRRRSRCCPILSSAPAPASPRAGRSPPSTPCWPTATTAMIRSSIRRDRFLTGISCCRARWPSAASIPRSTSAHRSAG